MGGKIFSDNKDISYCGNIGCKTPGRKDKLFNCGAMTAKQEDLNSALSPCGSGSHVIYAWALNAPELMLPEGVGFRVGGPDSEIDWLVLQVHYASISRIPEEGKTTMFYEKILFRRDLFKYGSNIQISKMFLIHSSR